MTHMFSGLSAAQPARRRWTALASFALQAALLTAALVFPMLYPQNLPQVFLAQRIFVPMSNGEVRAATNPGRSGSSGLTLAHPIVVSSNVNDFRVLDAVPLGDNPPPGLETVGNSNSNSTIISLISGAANPILPSVRPARPPRTSVMMEGNLIRRVEPQYPSIAKQIRLEGAVVLKAIISREGNIERLEVVSGPGLLARAARDAVLQWKYRPYLLNQEPVEVETQITVNF